MNNQPAIDYERIAAAIDYIRDNFKAQPDLEVLAKQINLSPFHFQRLFSEWAGTTPKKFLQYTSIEHAKRLLKEQQATLFDTAFETGFSSTSRLHDLFINIEGITPAEYKNGGNNLTINYSFAVSPFGDVLVASTAKGVCHLAFINNEQTGLNQLQLQFPNAHYQQKLDMLQQNALYIFTQNWQ
jgi:AraC family transcriptional regulator of adaptative response/methylated-DNA-[protein]-cysteine methyltransferase